MEAVVLEALRRSRSAFGVVDRAAEGARRAEADVVDQDDQDVRRPFRRPQLLDRRKRRGGILRVEGGQPDGRDVGDGQNVALRLGHRCLLVRYVARSLATAGSRLIAQSG